MQILNYQYLLHLSIANEVVLVSQEFSHNFGYVIIIALEKQHVQVFVGETHFQKNVQTLSC
jgi:hypothetical protein